MKKSLLSIGIVVLIIALLVVPLLIGRVRKMKMEVNGR